MSRDPVATALRAAARHGVPYVHRDGCFVVLVITGGGSYAAEQLTGDVRTRMCSSAGLARLVAARALADLKLFPDARDSLRVSELYAEAALRHALRRARRDWRAA
ncbi:MAG TPA: hypothetical protein VED01_03390 [Burkholderiales bacterium]|nr:hypothetical protein [Burkholderiales bacterium]